MRVAEHFRQLSEHIPYLQANFIFGLDSDRGNEPVELTKQFMLRTPFVWPTLNIPVPFGGTPLHAEYLRNRRILDAMPFGFYYAPYLVTTLKHYDPVTFYEKLIDLLRFSSSPEMLQRRWRNAPNRLVGRVNWARTMRTRAEIGIYRKLRDQLRTDQAFREFHEGRHRVASLQRCTTRLHCSEGGGSDGLGPGSATGANRFIIIGHTAGCSCSTGIQEFQNLCVLLLANRSATPAEGP